jgi:hypothetical protein
MAHQGVLAEFPSETIRDSAPIAICALAAGGPPDSLLEIPRPVLLHFLQTLHDGGIAELAPDGRDVAACVGNAGSDPDEARKIRRILNQWHGEAVMDLPGAALEFHPEAAVWGATLLFRAACLTTFREIGEVAIHELLQGRPMPDASDPAAHFSADLCLRHWPDVYRMARARAEDDPLVKVMSGLAAVFPLSSLGMSPPLLPDSPVIRRAGLRQIFAERALERSDHACLAVPEIDALVRLKLGAYAAILGRGLLSPALES